MRVFEQKNNGYRETVTWKSGLWSLIFGVLYLVYFSLWRNIVILSVLIVTSYAIEYRFCIIVYYAYITVIGFNMKSILSTQYLRAGWVEVKMEDIKK
jgi:hypothetical protein